ncbi:discoidin domain-containing protein [Pectobacterium carotovorum]|uniref:discoidin domain-containing protein n=2 Tax=Pectobacterium carotovorum TaxID=554 RepID=UPI0015DDA36F|nr:discoidin domain-containing protein [Pectobacterium carotovorum]MDK9421325.1 discoidin domain-containing protein [Pectobacterium carotovorum]QLL94298.1 discoidin domain-containing protein [Pectobacterium carotovorum]
MKDINIEINVCDSTGKSTCTVHPHTCCHSDNGGGQEPGVSGVASVFGRTGIVTAQPGDYTADQITETATRKFASPDEKTIWNAKQDALISGTTIRTLFGQSLLGSGDISPTPAQMGVAAADHTHTTADITDYTQKTKQLIHSSLEAGAGVTLSYNPVNEKTVISATGGGSGSGGSGYIVADRQGATAGQNHAFSISPQNTFNLAAYALKEEAGAANQTYVVDDFGASSKANYDATDDVIFDGTMHEYTGEMFTLNNDGGFFSAPVRADGKSVNISVVKKSVVPKMTSNTSPVGYVISASDMSRPQFLPYFAFDNDNNLSSNEYDCWGGLNAATVANPHWIRVDLPTPTTISSYSFANRTVIYNNGPKNWVFQGSNDNGNSWDDLHVVNNDINNTLGAVRSYSLSSPGKYKSFRLLVTAGGNNNNYLTLKKFNLFQPEKVLISSNDKWYSANNGVLTEISTADFDSGFTNSGWVSNASISDMLPIKIVGSAQIDLRSSYIPYTQIAIQKSLTSAVWAKINSATLTATQTGNGKVRVAVTRDLVNWHVLRNGAWVDVGALSADTAGATKLIADGMTPTELSGITAAQWAQLFSSNNGVPDSLAFAFALDITDPVTDVATIDRLVLNVNDASSWKAQSPAEVEIRWRTDSVTFRTATAGNYKLAYQVP